MAHDSSRLFSPGVVRYPWRDDFPDILIHAPESAVKKHAAYPAAKAGDVGAAYNLIRETLNDQAVSELAEVGRVLTARPILIHVHAQESAGINVIPAIISEFLQLKLGWLIERRVAQANVVNHTGADGFSRISRQAFFVGKVEKGNYVLVDDFIGQGGTIANFRGHLLHQGANVVCATVLTGKPHSARVQQTAQELDELRAKHGTLETWWTDRFGFGFDCLTASETRYLFRTEPTARVRERVEQTAP